MELHEFDYKKDSIIVIVNSILKDAILYKASDVHFDTKEDGMFIKFRINGDLVLYSKIDESHKKDIITRVKIMSGLNITNTSKFQSGSFVYNYDNKNINLRISCVPVLNGEKIVIHVSSFEKKIPTIEELDFSDNNLVKIKKLLSVNSGVLILVGGMGSGKNTTFYTILNNLDADKMNIISIEKKIKVKIDNVNQIKADESNIESLIKDALLLDPNILLIDEMDSADIINTVLKIANSGGSIITTMQGKNGYDAISLLMNMKVENYLCATSISGIVSQRLVKRLCPKCKKKRETNEYEKQVFNKLLGKNVREIFEPVGCKDCCNGYDKRIPLAEVITFDDSIKKALINSKEQKSLKKIIYDKNDSIIVDGLNRVINGDTSLEEILDIIDLDTLASQDIDIKMITNNTHNEIDNASNDKVDTPSLNNNTNEKKEDNIETNSNTDDSKDSITEETSTAKESTEKNDDSDSKNNKDEKTDVSADTSLDDKKKENDDSKKSINNEDNVTIESSEKNDDDSKVDVENNDESQNDEDDFVINIKSDDSKEEKQEADDSTINDSSKQDETKETNDIDKKEEEKIQKKKKKNDKPSLDKLSTNMGAFDKIKKPSYDDFDYDDMNAI